MSSEKAKSLFNEALTLSDQERLWLADELIISVKPPGVMSVDDPGFAAELARRIEAVDNGTAVLLSAEEAMKSLRESLKARSQQRSGHD